MASENITKHSAAQRQIDAAIRILFSGEDVLAAHTVVAAAHRIVLDIAENRNSNPYTESIKNYSYPISSAIRGGTLDP